jgi:hypothetical protein
MTLLVLILIIIAGLAIVFFVPQLMLRRAIFQIVRNFREQNATTPNAARTLEELRLQPRSYLQRITSLRD